MARYWRSFAFTRYSGGVTTLADSPEVLAGSMCSLDRLTISEAAKSQMYMAAVEIRIFKSSSLSSAAIANLKYVIEISAIYMAYRVLNETARTVN